MENKNYLIKNLSDYESLFRNINLYDNNRMVIFLKGELGSGKTTFVQNYLKYKYAFTNTSSPTFGIVNTYLINKIMIYHYDLYRITKPAELNDIGFYDNLDQDALHFIEWPEIIPKQISKPNIIINFQLLSKERIISINIV
ncbi:MAG: tRNA (adenosine(37)-N6)-threonylcarbamoyltransferase complex ATPase subunit type 1 TsaE [Gammaproteobacteria bacterium]|tara:strand:- start:248 stop:670 length:423 start_codon:yes stop_codon:yes gene_type:complete